MDNRRRTLDWSFPTRSNSAVTLTGFGSGYKSTVRENNGNEEKENSFTMASYNSHGLEQNGIQQQRSEETPITGFTVNRKNPENSENLLSTSSSTWFNSLGSKVEAGNEAHGSAPNDSPSSNPKPLFSLQAPPPGSFSATNSNLFSKPFANFASSTSQIQSNASSGFPTPNYITPLNRIRENEHLFKTPANPPPIVVPVVKHVSTPRPRKTLDLNKTSPATANMGKLFQSLTPSSSIAPVKVPLKKIDNSSFKRMSFSGSYFNSSSVQSSPMPVITTPMALPSSSVPSVNLPAINLPFFCQPITATPTTLENNDLTSSPALSDDSEVNKTVIEVLPPTPTTPDKECDESFFSFSTPNATQNQTMSAFYTPNSSMAYTSILNSTSPFNSSTANNDDTEAAETEVAEPPVINKMITPAPIRIQRRANANIANLVSKLANNVTPPSPLKSFQSLSSPSPSMSPVTVTQMPDQQLGLKDNDELEVIPEHELLTIPTIIPAETEKIPQLELSSDLESSIGSDGVSFSDMETEVEEDGDAEFGSVWHQMVEIKDERNPVERPAVLEQILDHISSSKELLKCRLVCSTWNAAASQVLKMRNKVCIIFNYPDETSMNRTDAAEATENTRSKVASLISQIELSTKPFFCQRYILKHPKLDDAELQKFFKLQGPSITHLCLTLRPSEDFKVFIHILYEELLNLCVLELLQSPLVWHWPNTILPRTLPKLRTLTFTQDYSSQNQHLIRSQNQNQIQGQLREPQLVSFTGHSSPWLIQQILRAAINLEQVINFPVGLLPMFQYENKVPTIKSTTLYFSITKKKKTKEIKQKKLFGFDDNSGFDSASDSDFGSEQCDFDFIRNYTTMANQNIQLTFLKNTFMSRIVQNPVMWGPIGQILFKILHSSRFTLKTLETEPFGFLTGIQNQQQNNGSIDGRLYLPIFPELDLIHFHIPNTHFNGGKQFIHENIKNFFPYGSGGDLKTCFQNVRSIILTSTSASDTHFLIARLDQYYPLSVFQPGVFSSVVHFQFGFTDGLQTKERNKAGRKENNNEASQLEKDVRRFTVEFPRFLSIFGCVRTCEVNGISVKVLGSFLKHLFSSWKAWLVLEKLVVYIKGGKGLGEKDNNNGTIIKSALNDYPFLDEIITGLPEVRCRWLRVNNGRVQPILVEQLRSSISILNLRKLKIFNVVFETRADYIHHIHENPIISFVSSVYGFLLMDQKLQGNFFCRRN